MHKKLLALTILGFYSQTSVFADTIPTTSPTVISDKKGNTVVTEDINLLLKPAPISKQLGLLKNKELLAQKLQELYLTKAIAVESKQVRLSAKEQLDLNQLLDNFYFQRKINQLTTENLPDFEPLAKQQFEAKKGDYTHPERVAVEHILIDTKQHKDKAALKLANSLIVQLKKGADFAQLADQYSNDPGVKTNHGDLGEFGKGAMIKEFEEAAYALKLKEISKPVKTSYGYHIIRKYDQKAAGPKSYAEVKDELTAKIKHDYIQKRLDDYYEKVKTDNSVDVNAQAIDNYVTDKTKQLESELAISNQKTKLP